MNPFDQLLQHYTGKQSVLGAAVAVLKNGEVVYAGGYGTTSVEENGGKITPQTLFAIGSISKTICATLILRLVEENLLDLDTPVLDYLPDLKFSDPDYGRKTTLRNILSHSTGLPSAGKDWGPRDPDSLRRFVHGQIPYYSFLAEPGMIHLYSSTVFCISGHIAEVVAGKYYDELVQKYVFDPLEMKRITYDPAVALTFPVALPHETRPDGELMVTHLLPYNVSGNPSGFAYASVLDLVNLAQMYLNHGRFGDDVFLAPASIEEMQKSHVSRHIEAAAHPLAHLNLGYGLGFYVGNYQGRRSARHGGMSQSFNCFFDLFPDDGAGVILLTNYSQDKPLMELVAGLYNQALEIPGKGIKLLEKPASNASSLDEGLLDDYVGTYINVESAGLLTISNTEGELHLEREESTLPLIKFDDDQFYAETSEKSRLPVSFVKNAQSTVTCLIVAGDPYFPIQIDHSFQPDFQLWKSYTGVYKDPSNSNRDEIIFVSLQEELLFIAEDDHKVLARAINNRSFLSDLGLIEFEETQWGDLKILILGKATRCYPLDEYEYRQNKVIKFLLDV